LRLGGLNHLARDLAYFWTRTNYLRSHLHLVWRVGDAERLLDRLVDLVERHSLGSQRGAAMRERRALGEGPVDRRKDALFSNGCFDARLAERNVSFVSVYTGALARLGRNGIARGSASESLKRHR